MAHMNGTASGEGSAGDAGGTAASLDDISCPLRFDRLEYVAIREGTVKPYLLGGQQRPHCKNCKSDRAWATFCKFEFRRFYGCVSPNPGLPRAVPPACCAGQAARGRCDPSGCHTCCLALSLGFALLGFGYQLGGFCGQAGGAGVPALDAAAAAGGPDWEGGARHPGGPRDAGAHPLRPLALPQGPHPLVCRRLHDAGTPLHLTLFLLRLHDAFTSPLYYLI
jgi:hypothetical protein